ncbi:MAG: ribosome maturation factor RimM, partial [Actinomycetota bacterium]
TVRPLSDNPDRFRAGETALVGPDPEAALAMEMESVRIAGGSQPPGKIFLKFDGIEDRDAAAKIRGHLIFGTDTSAPAANAGEYWEHQLAGCEVFDTSGRRLGVFGGVVQRPAQDLWEVDTAGGSVLVPAVEGIVKAVELDQRRITVDPPEGLFE